MNTEQKIISMLKQSTGIHMLDSGMANGRHWQQNQSRQFTEEPARTLTFKYGYIELTLNIFHYLNERLEYAESMQNDFIEWDKQSDPDRDISWFESIDLYIEHLRDSGHEIMGGIYADSSELVTVNTYNHESLLSQVIQFTLVHIDDIAYIVLMIHNGADVRGGYTSPVFFESNGMYSETETVLFDDSDSSIVCSTDRQHNWYTDDSYHWYEDGSAGVGAGRQLEDYPLIDLKSIDMLGYGATVAYTHAFKVSHDLADPTLFYDSESGVGYCPLCGSRLE